MMMILMGNTCAHLGTKHLCKKVISQLLTEKLLFLNERKIVREREEICLYIL